MGDEPTAAFVLSLIGGVTYLIIGLFVAIAAAFMGSIAGMVGLGMVVLAAAAVGGIGLLSGIPMIVGSMMMRSPSKSLVRTGSVVLLVFTLVGALFTVGGLPIGFIPALVGSILGLTWNPSTLKSPPGPPPATV